MALTSIQNNSQRSLFWHEGPKQSREYVQGEPNHAFNEQAPKTAIAQPEFYPNGRRNHSYTSPENAAKKPVEAQDAWQEIIDMHMKNWVTPGQQVKLQNELNAGLAAGKSRREIAASLGAIVRDQRRGR
jgi:hypothetical protein